MKYEQLLKIKKEEIINENKKLKETLDKSFDKNILFDSLFDDLTNFLNQKFFINNTMFLTLLMIEGLIYNKNNNTNQKTFSVLFCDVDGLKMINDTKGHSVVDDYIKKVANIISSSIRSNRDDIVDNMFSLTSFNNNIPIRIGGDEFLIILPNCNKELAYSEVSTRIKQKIEKTFKNDIPTKISLSIGVADTNEVKIPNDLTDEAIKIFLNNLIRIAEDRMYSDKHASKKKASIIDKQQYLEKELRRISDNLGLNLNNDEDYNLFKQIVNESTNNIKEENKKSR